MASIAPSFQPRAQLERAAGSPGRAATEPLLSGAQGFGEGVQIVGSDADDATDRAINVCNERQRYGESDRQDEKEEGASLVRHVADQHIAEDGDRYEECPCRDRD